MPAKLRYHGAPAAVVPLTLILGLAAAGVAAWSGAGVAAKQPKCGAGPRERHERKS